MFDIIKILINLNFLYIFLDKKYIEVIHTSIYCTLVRNMNMLHFFKYFGLCMKRGNGSSQEENYLGLLLG